MEAIGFHKKGEREISKLETKTGIRFVEKDKDPFPNEIGKYVRVIVAGTGINGVYRGLNENGYLVLLPHLDQETIPFSKTNNEKFVNKYFWENERPRYIREIAVVGLSPVRKEYLDDLITGKTVETSLDI